MLGFLILGHIVLPAKLKLLIYYIINVEVNELTRGKQMSVQFSTHIINTAHACVTTFYMYDCTCMHTVYS